MITNLENFSKETLDAWSKGLEKNRLLKWTGSDIESTYKYNLKHNRDLMKKVPRDVVYKTNDNGFRCDNFDKQTVILFNGCSHTFGTGINVEDTYASLLAKELDIPYHNVSLGGSDISLAVSRSVYWLLKLRPKVHFFQCPPSARVGHYTDKRTTKNTSLGLNFVSSAHDTDLWPPHKRELMLEENIEWNYYSSICTLKQICQELNIKLIFKTWQELNRPYPKGTLQKPILTEEERYLARDLVHAGIEQNLRVFQGLLKEGLL